MIKTIGGKDTKGFVMRGRPVDTNKNDSPGPGMYDPSDSVIKDRVVTHSISKSPARGDNLLSKSQRELPGPGTYEASHPLKLAFGKGLAFKFTGKPKNNQDTTKPGPGFYDPKAFLSKAKVTNTIFSKLSRGELIPKQTKELPGPGNYINN